MTFSLLILSQVYHQNVYRFDQCSFDLFKILFLKIINIYYNTLIA